MRPGEKEREREGRRGEKCTRPNRRVQVHLGRCLSRISCSIHPRGIFFPLLPFPPLLRRRPVPLSPRPLTRSLARQASHPKQCSHSSSTSTTTTTTTLPLRLSSCESTRSTRNYSIRDRDTSRFWGNVKIICRGVRKRQWLERFERGRKGDKIIIFFFDF